MVFVKKIRHKRFFGTNVGQLSRSRAGSVVMFLFLLVFAQLTSLPRPVRVAQLLIC